MTSDATCGGCGAPVPHPAIKYCAKVACQQAACRHYRVKYVPYDPVEERRKAVERKQARRQRQQPSLDSKGYGQHAGRRQLNKER